MSYLIRYCCYILHFLTYISLYTYMWQGQVLWEVEEPPDVKPQYIRRAKIPMIMPLYTMKVPHNRQKLPFSIKFIPPCPKWKTFYDVACVYRKRASCHKVFPYPWCENFSFKHGWATSAPQKHDKGQNIIKSASYTIQLTHCSKPPFSPSTQQLAIVLLDGEKGPRQKNPDSIAPTEK